MLRLITDSERRARLALRHGLSADRRFATVEEATSALVALHTTEPATVYLSLQARVDDVGIDDVDRALYDERTVVKQLAMRRTLFTFPRDLLPAAWGSASRRTADMERKRLAKDVESGGLADDGGAWIDRAVAATEERLADGDELSAAELREQVPELTGQITVSPDKAYGGTFQIAPRVVILMGAEGRIARGRNDGHWRTSRPRWCSMASWLGEPGVPEPTSSPDGYAELVGRWLGAFGPGTLDDIQWWLGSTKTAVRTALTDLEAVEVALERDQTGWALPTDVDGAPSVEPWGALLPVLDATLMGWKERRFYLPPDHKPQLFDSNGNGGTTVWWDGRVVGCWVQDDEGVVQLALLEDVGADATEVLQAKADALTRWLDGTVVATVYPSAAMKKARKGAGSS